MTDRFMFTIKQIAFICARPYRGVVSSTVRSVVVRLLSDFWFYPCYSAYYDINGKDASPLLTCSLFSYCHTAADADNRGGQTEPDGSVDYIIDSDGYCKLWAPDPQDPWFDRTDWRFIVLLLRTMYSTLSTSRSLVGTADDWMACKRFQITLCYGFQGICIAWFEKYVNRVY